MTDQLRILCIKDIDGNMHIVNLAEISLHESVLNAGIKNSLTGEKRYCIDTKLRSFYISHVDFLFLYDWFNAFTNVCNLSRSENETSL